MTLYPRERAVMLTIQAHLAINGVMPTIEDIAKGVGLSSKGRTHHLVAALCEKGYLAKDAYTARGLTILKPVPDDRFEEAAKAVCGALHKEPNPENIKSAREAIFAALVESAA